VKFILGGSISHCNMVVKTTGVAATLRLRPLVESMMNRCRSTRAEEWRLHVRSSRCGRAGSTSRSGSIRDAHPPRLTLQASAIGHLPLQAGSQQESAKLNEPSSG
jgi:hypothetical protein